MVAILPAEVADLDRIAAVQRAAFGPSLINQRIFGQVQPEDHRKNSVKRFTMAVQDPHSALLKAVVNGEIVGFALWELPTQDPADSEQKKKDREADPDRWPVGTNVALAESFFGRLDLKIGEPHYHLSMLAIDPAYQRTGAGGALLKWGCERADDKGVDCYLEATQEGIRLYRRAGFKDFREPIVAEEDAELILYPMRRPGLILRPVTRADLPALAPAHRLAFWPTKVNTYAYSEVQLEDYESHFISRFSKFIDQRDNEGARYLITLALRGDTYLGFGFSSYEVDKAERPADSGEQRSWPKGANVRRAEEYLLGTLDKHKKENLPFAHCMHGKPELQRACRGGQGIGRRLVQEVLDCAKRDGVPVTLESTELGMPLYKKMGFVHFGEILRAREDDQVQLWPMRRDC